MKNKNLFAFTLLLFLFLPASLFCQSSGKLDKQTYKLEKDSLLSFKKNLTFHNQKLQSDIDSLKEYLKLLDKRLEAAAASLKKKQRSLYIAKYGKKYGIRISDGRVWKGMTDKMLNDSWGKPDKIHKNVYKWGVFTQWYYGDIIYFFKNGKLIAWEEKK